MKKFCINVLLIFVISIAMFGCDGKSKVEHFFGKNNKKYYDFIVGLKDAKCVTDYPDDTRIKDIESIKFGRYDLDIQSHDYEMYGHVGVEDIEWVVLEKTQNSALLLSKHPVSYMGHSKQADEFVYWSNSDIREWLNNEFYSTAFNDIEKLFIRETELKTLKNMYGRSYEDEITIDRLFLISQQDCYKYFNANVENYNEKICTSEYDYRGEDYGSGTDFWTRTPYEYDGKDIYHAYDAFNISFADVTAHGMVDAGYLPLPMCVGVRPAMWVRY